MFELTPEVEQLLSSAYIPLLTHLVQMFSDELPTHQLESLLRQAGKELAADLLGGKRPSGNFASRVTMASKVVSTSNLVRWHMWRETGAM